MRLRASLLVFSLISAGFVWLGCSDEEEGAAPASSGAKDAGVTDAPVVVTDKDADPAPPVSLEPYRIVGRFDSRDPAGPRFGWPGTQVIARFTGDTISVDLADTSGEDQFDVSIDGNAPTLLDVDQQEKKTYELAKGLGAGEHTLVLTKRTESLVGETQLIKINATLVGTPPPPSRRIEMVGDSITAGYGVLGADQSCGFSPETEAEPLAWGALAAKELNAVHTSIAWSGIGVYEDDEDNRTNQMPERYKRALATDPASTWTASLFEPDVIVIGLGTNDFAGDPPGDSFGAKMTEFVAAVREVHPSSNIVLATSPMLEDQNKADQKKAFEATILARKTAGDTKVTLLDIDTTTEAEGFGCDYHPSKATQSRMSKALVAHVKPLTGW